MVSEQASLSVHCGSGTNRALQMVSEQASLPVRCGLGTNQAEAGGHVTARLNTPE